MNKTSGWTKWMPITDLARTIGYSETYISHFGVRNGWAQQRKALDDERGERKLRRFVFRANLSIKKTGRANRHKPAAVAESIQKYINGGHSIDALSEWQTASDLARLLGVDYQRLYRNQAVTEMHDESSMRRVPDRALVSMWLSISQMASVLNIPRTNLERRLFGDSLEWAHYDSRLSARADIKWECRIMPGYGPSALTRDVIAVLL